MKKSTAYFSILLITLAVVLVGYLVPVGSIKHFAHGAFHAAFNPWIAISAAACAFIFINNQHYWLINIACGVIAAIVVLLLHKSGLGVMNILIRATAFVYIVYILNYIRLIIGKQ